MPFRSRHPLALMAAVYLALVAVYAALVLAVAGAMPRAPGEYVLPTAPPQFELVGR